MVMIDMIHKARGSPFQTGWSSILKIDAILFLYHWLVSRKGSLINLGMIDMMHETSGSSTQIGWSSIIEIDAILLLLACVSEMKLDKTGIASHGSTCHPLWLDAILLLLACVSERKLDKPGHASHGSTCHPLWIFGSIHEKHPDMGSTRSMLFPNFGSMISMAEHPPVRSEEWDVESHWSKEPGCIIQIYPKKGDVWALYRNWAPDWRVMQRPEDEVHQYDMIVVLEDYLQEQGGVSVAPLIKVTGFKTVFRPHPDPEKVIRNPKE